MLEHRVLRMDGCTVQENNVRGFAIDKRRRDKGHGRIDVTDMTRCTQRIGIRRGCRGGGKKTRTCR
jgi:hypothetical protein